MTPLRYAEYAPSPALAPYVRCHWAFEGDASAGRGAEERIAPDGRPELIFHLGAPFERLDDRGSVLTQHRAVFVGQIDRAMTVRPTGRAAIFAVRFRAAGAAAFCGGAARSLAGLSVPVGDLWPGAGADLADRIADAAGDRERVALVEKALLARLRPPRETAFVAAAVSRIAAAGGLLRIDDLAADLGASRRTVERAFDDLVGLPPKTLARIVRFRRALESLSAPRRPSFVAVALDCGYSDQSHLVREFRAFTGAPPTEYLADARPMADHFAGDV